MEIFKNWKRTIGKPDKNSEHKTLQLDAKILNFVFSFSPLYIYSYKYYIVKVTTGLYQKCNKTIIMVKPLQFTITTDHKPIIFQEDVYVKMSPFRLVYHHGLFVFPSLPSPFFRSRLIAHLEGPPCLLPVRNQHHPLRKVIRYTGTMGKSSLSSEHSLSNGRTA